MTGTRRLRKLSVISLAMIGLAGCDAKPATPDLYQAKAFVTGQDDRFRQDGFAQSLPDVLVKVSGDPQLAHDPRVAGLSAGVEALIAGYTYHDRMAGIPIGDEQGTRDRPYDLVVSFKPDKIDAVLKSLGRAPWAAARPAVKLYLAVRNHARDYVLASDGEFGVDQRDAVAAAAWQLGLNVQLPSQAELAAAHLAFKDIDTPVALPAGVEPSLTGTMIWTDGFIGWHALWRLRVHGEVHSWAINDVSYDEAFRSAMRGAAQILSGHGQPAS